MSSRSPIVTTALCLALIASVSQAKTTKTVQVDCTKGDSISAALEEKDDELIIEITGECQERVIIRRGGVTLRGSDPAVDGIVGPAGVPAEGDGLLEVWSARPSPVHLERLSIRDSEYSGVYVIDSEVTITNCRLVDNGWFGLRPTTGAWVSVYDSTISGNGSLGLAIGSASGGWCESCRIADNGSGMGVAHASRGWCIDCALEGNHGDGFIVETGAIAVCWQCQILDNEGWAVSAQLGGYAQVWDSTISGDQGVWARDGHVEGWDSQATVTEVGLSASDQGEIRWRGGNLTGSIEAVGKSLVWLYEGATQLDSLAGGNSVAQSSTLLVHDWATLEGSTTLDTFSNGEARNESSVGSLSCVNGGNFYCDGTVIKYSSTCGLCP